jgi:hypothetical protein
VIVIETETPAAAASARRTTRRRTAWVGVALAVVAGAGAAILTACETSSNATAYTPYEGIDVPTSLVTTGVGCGLDSGIAYFATVLAHSPATLADGAAAPTDGAAATPDANGGCGAFPEPAAIIPGAASVVACFTASASFELDASGPLDVWLFGYEGAMPANVGCTDPTCPLTTDAGVPTLFADQVDPATRAIRTLKCTANPELSQHPQAYGCIECPAAPSDSGSDAGADAAVEGGDAATGD